MRLEWNTSVDPETDTWRRLLDYANEEFALEALLQRHGEPARSVDLKNYKKQASNLRTALHQAHEYFEAARSATQLTAPNPLYYGAYSLASAVMLMRGNGEYSFDFLRRSSKNRTHGLTFTTGTAGSKATGRAEMLQDSFVAVNRFGHFPNFYSVLPPFEQVLAMTTNYIGSKSVNTYMAARGRQSTLAIDDLHGQKRSILELCGHIPDLAFDLRRYRLGSAASRCNFEVMQRNGQAYGYRWRFHGAGTRADLEAILDQFRFPYQLITEVDAQIEDEATGGIVYMQDPGPEQPVSFQFPTIRTTADGDQVAFARDIDTPEIADLYRVAYGLSMLARYYPDVWVHSIESHSVASRVVALILPILRRKLLAATLSLFEETIVIASSHRAPWYS